MTSFDIAKLKLAALGAFGAAIGIAAAVVLSTLQQLPISYGSSSRLTLPSQAATTSFTSSPTDTSNNTTPQQVSDTTSNWAGYISTGGTYTTVSGSWDVPTVSAGSDAMSADATWIGIGGESSNDLIQIGTQNSVENGQVSTGSFYERLPETSVTIPGIDVNPGDAITASVKMTGTDAWTISITDLTNGESYTNTVAYSSSQSSAEWIEEAPSMSSGIIPLDDFGSVSFTGASTTVNGSKLSIANSNAEAVTMNNDSGEALTSISSLNATGDGFTVSRTSASSDSSYGSYGQYYVEPGSGWRRHEPGLDTWGNGWGGYGSGQSDPSTYILSY